MSNPRRYRPYPNGRRNTGLSFSLIAHFSLDGSLLVASMDSPNRMVELDPVVAADRTLRQLSTVWQTGRDPEVAPVEIIDPNDEPESPPYVIPASLDRFEVEDLDSGTEEETAPAVATGEGGGCRICLDPEITDPVSPFTCAHQFCRVCADGWLQVDRTHEDFGARPSTCPLCRAPPTAAPPRTQRVQSERWREFFAWTHAVDSDSAQRMRVNTMHRAPPAVTNRIRHNMSEWGWDFGRYERLWEENEDREVRLALQISFERARRYRRRNDRARFTEELELMDMLI